jgi:DNA-binding NarL/FixJ family response regulator
MTTALGLIVEDDVLASTLLSKLADYEGGIEAVTARNVKEAVDLAERMQLQFALLDLNLGIGPSGLDLAHKLRQLHPSIGLVLLTSYSDLRFHSSSPKLPAGMRVLFKGSSLHLNQVFENCLDAVKFPFQPQRTSTPYQQLSDADFELWRLIAAGRSNSELASIFEVGEKAIEKRLHKLNRELGLDSTAGKSSRVEMVRLFVSITGQIPRA